VVASFVGDSARVCAGLRRERGRLVRSGDRRVNGVRGAEQRHPSGGELPDAGGSDGATAAEVAAPTDTVEDTGQKDSNSIGPLEMFCGYGSVQGLLRIAIQDERLAVVEQTVHGRRGQP
jgi:hypothetical protein